MAELVVVVNIDNYGNTEDEDVAVLQQIRTAVLAVVGLCDLAVNTFVVSSITEAENADSA